MRRDKLLPLLRVVVCLGIGVCLLALRPSAVTAQLPTPTPTPVAAAVSAPLPGEALQGVVTIQGVTGVPGFRSAEISFAYQADRTGTWFLLHQASAPVSGGPLAAWDTTTITDGFYRLRLLVYVEDGPAQEVLLEGLRVRNYLPVETSTPGAQPAVQSTATPTPPPLPDYRPAAATLQPLPTNPAEITAAHLGASALRGGLAAGGLLLGGVLIVIARRMFRR